MNAAAPITPETKVAQLLEDHPALEEVLVSLAPAFSKLRNPVLRRTIARVTTLKRAAEVRNMTMIAPAATARAWCASTSSTMTYGLWVLTPPTALGGFCSGFKGV